MLWLRNKEASFSILKINFIKIVYNPTSLLDFVEICLTDVRCDSCTFPFFLSYLAHTHYCLLFTRYIRLVQSDNTSFFFVILRHR